MPTCHSPLIVALDFSDITRAHALVDQLDPTLCRLKVGKELFTATGPAFIETVQRQGFEVFLDLKFHDIPNTVAKAVTVAAQLGVWMVNVHALGGIAMMEAARAALVPFQRRPHLVAVTVLTSLRDADLRAVGLSDTVENQVLRLATLAQQAQLDGVVCSAREASHLRDTLGDAFLRVTPGIRLPDSPADDQQRIVTPTEARAAGAHYLVVGRPIAQSPDPRTALATFYQFAR